MYRQEKNGKNTQENKSRGYLGGGNCMDGRQLMMFKKVF